MSTRAGVTGRGTPRAALRAAGQGWRCRLPEAASSAGTAGPSLQTQHLQGGQRGEAVQGGGAQLVVVVQHQAAAG